MWVFVWLSISHYHFGNLYLFFFIIFAMLLVKYSLFLANNQDTGKRKVYSLFPWSVNMLVAWVLFLGVGLGFFLFFWMGRFRIICSCKTRFLLRDFTLSKCGQAWLKRDTLLWQTFHVGLKREISNYSGKQFNCLWTKFNYKISCNLMLQPYLIYFY